MGEMVTFIEAYVVNELCAECILGMDFINKYKLIINAEERVVSLQDDQKRITLKFDVNQKNTRYPARTTSYIYIPPKRTVSVPVNVGISSAKMLFRPSVRLTQRSSMVLLNNILTVKYKKSYVSIYNPTSYPYSLPKGIILGTTTIPTLSFNKSLAIDHQVVDKHINNLIRHISNPEQQDKIKFILNQHAKLFDTSKPTIVDKVKPHEIKTRDHPPPASKPYYSTPHKQEQMYNITKELLNFGLIRPSYSPYAAPALLVSKQDGSWRLVVDYKKLNDITIKDNYPLPNMEQALQTLGGGYKYFSKLDMKSGFWQIPIKEEDKYKTAFITTDGLYEWNVLAQGLRNSPPSFQRVMVHILSPCRQSALAYIDDIVVYSRSFEEHLQHISQLLSILSKHNFQLNPAKCSMFQQKIDYLSHTITEYGVRPNNEKIQAIIKLREPSTLAEANKFLGAISWYRKFIPQFATIAAPIHKITNLTKPNRKQFVWGDAQKQAFFQLKELLIKAPLLLDFPNDDYPLILTTDASKVGIGGTLQQKINGEIKNLYYHSQVTNSTQRRYDPIELEALAIWLCFQRMRSYLLGRSIIIYTDHCPLCNMMKSTVKNRRVDRISILLQEFNIEKIIHIKGRHNCLADYLSRHPIPREEEIFNEDYGISTLFQGEPPKKVHVPANNTRIVGAVITRSKTKQIAQQRDQIHTTIPATTDDKLPTLDKEEIQNSDLFSSNNFDITQIKIEQAKDPIIQNKMKEIMKDTTKHSYVIKDDLLYKLVVTRANCITKAKLIYLPSSMINSLLQSYHNDPLSGHFGMRRTYLKIKNKFWWPHMKQSITQHIQACLPCQQYNTSRKKKPGQLYPIPIPEGPFQLIGIDYCGPFKETPSGNQYVLCITDYFTRWVEAIALPNCSAQTTAQALFKEYICRYGVPKSILSDQGTHFKNQLMEAMAKLIGYNHIYSSVYHPQTNGMVERFNATFVPQIAKLQDRENNNWDEFLLPVVFAYNTGIHATTGYSPFQLQFGHDPRLPTDEPPTSFIFNKPQDYYQQLKKNLLIIQRQTRDNVNSRQQRYKNRYDKQRADPHYEINDLVLIKVYGTRTKLDPKYSITSKVIIKKQHPIYWVRDEETKVESRVHVNDIRPIFIPKTK